MDDREEKILLGQIPKAPHSRLRPKSVSTILDRLILERGYAAEQSTQLLQDEWKAAVGESLAAQSRVGKVQRGVLQVTVPNGMILTELTYTKSSALKHLQRALPDFKIRDIRIKLA